MKRVTLIIITLSMLVGKLAAENLPLSDYKRLHFGFSLGLNVLDYGIKNSMINQNGRIYQADIENLMPGFSVGLVTDVRLNNYFNLRLVPTFYLGERTLSYMNNVDQEVFKSTIKSTFITVPILLKYSAVRINNYKPYLLCGGGALFEFSSDQTKPVLQKTVDFFVEFGLGCTFYTEYFRLSPEIKFALGFRNIHTPWEARKADPLNYIDPEMEPYSLALDKLTSRIVTIVLNFE